MRVFFELPLLTLLFYPAIWVMIQYQIREDVFENLRRDCADIVFSVNVPVEGVDDVVFVQQ